MHSGGAPPPPKPCWQHMVLLPAHATVTLSRLATFRCTLRATSRIVSDGFRGLCRAELKMRVAIFRAFDLNDDGAPGGDGPRAFPMPIEARDPLGKDASIA